ncbi:UNVERIFIED_CONTAM: hypothetical protein Slati_2177800 [Sesamum latifolium]|uniref:Reverse transcriptase zinc-binding domain-containing protein n=1 Tax=Sesamum latifolium TaxID=2727402 RepID=A0AAW2WX63_9LAMI
MNWCGIKRVEGPSRLRVLIPWLWNSMKRGPAHRRGHSWNFIWNSKALPKVALFAWKSVCEALPTSENLKRLGVPVSNGCVSCSGDSEDILHVLFFCSFACLLWAVSGLPWGVLCCSTANVEWWFRRVHNELSRVEWKFFLSICWALWGAHNKKFFEGKHSEAHEIVRLARRVSGETRDVLVLEGVVLFMFFCVAFNFSAFM